jgi:hypothetical protein
MASTKHSPPKKKTKKEERSCIRMHHSCVALDFTFLQ